ncbi:hypothetical protein Y1Q_0001514 [Alligator mississippiensis]|uniref:Uncharacterized protein n=1 Tax=Alligator mississippiensis TaxID=8496 RepID=A0A151M9Q6_ALLMI|nr:hypothetical protein Y1Q_0001514 [Alligator mississippiensis]
MVAWSSKASQRAFNTYIRAAYFRDSRLQYGLHFLDARGCLDQDGSFHAGIYNLYGPRCHLKDEVSYHLLHVMQIRCGP